MGGECQKREMCHFAPKEPHTTVARTFQEALALQHDADSPLVHSEFTGCPFRDLDPKDGVALLQTKIIEYVWPHVVDWVQQHPEVCGLAVSSGREETSSSIAVYSLSELEEKLERFPTLAWRAEYIEDGVNQAIKKQFLELLGSTADDSAERAEAVELIDGLSVLMKRAGMVYEEPASYIVKAVGASTGILVADARAVLQDLVSIALDKNHKYHSQARTLVLSSKDFPEGESPLDSYLHRVLSTAVGLSIFSKEIVNPFKQSYIDEAGSAGLNDIITTDFSDGKVRQSFTKRGHDAFLETAKDVLRVLKRSQSDSGNVSKIRTCPARYAKINHPDVPDGMVVTQYFRNWIGSAISKFLIPHAVRQIEEAFENEFRAVSV